MMAYFLFRDFAARSINPPLQKTWQKWLQAILAQVCWFRFAPPQVLIRLDQMCRSSCVMSETDAKAISTYQLMLDCKHVNTHDARTANFLKQSCLFDSQNSATFSCQFSHDCRPAYKGKDMQGQRTGTLKTQGAAKRAMKCHHGSEFCIEIIGAAWLRRWPFEPIRHAVPRTPES